MKVGEKIPTSRQQRRARAQGFTETLQHARSGAWSSKAQAAAATARAADPTRSALGTRRALGDRASGVLRERREVFGEAERQASAPLPSVALPQQPAAAARVEAAPELRAIVRTLPIAIEAARVREGAPLSLALGRALSVDLRRGAGGLEIVLRPEATLGRAAAAELPGLLESLRLRGISVARAEVRPQPNGDAVARCPALTPPWPSATKAPRYGTVAKW